MRAVDMYQKETGDDSPDNQIFFHEWLMRYVKWLELNVEKLKPINMSELKSSSQEEAAPLTFGQRAVGLSFNPSGSNEVDKIKQLYGIVIDRLNDLRSNSTDPEVKRLASVAITEAQGAQMWAVRAITWKS